MIKPDWYSAWAQEHGNSIAHYHCPCMIDFKLINEIAYGNPPVQHVPGGNRIDSVVDGGGAAMSANVSISIEGPVVNGQMRGVKFMQVGFIQNIETAALHGTFNGFSPAEERVNSLEGSTLLDAADDAPAPWASNNAIIQNVPDAGYTKTISINDRPWAPFSDVPVLTGNGTNDAVDEAAILLKYTLYVAARTTDGENNADAVYVQTAAAHWYFNGSGTLTGADAADFGTWAGIMNVTGNGGDAAFTTVTTGSQVPVTTGPTFNKTAFTWTTTPPFPQ